MFDYLGHNRFCNCPNVEKPEKKWLEATLHSPSRPSPPILAPRPNEL